MRGSGTEREPGTRTHLRMFLEQQCRDACRDNPNVEVQTVDNGNFRIRVKGVKYRNNMPQYFRVHVVEER